MARRAVHRLSHRVARHAVAVDGAGRAAIHDRLDAELPVDGCRLLVQGPFLLCRCVPPRGISVEIAPGRTARDRSAGAVRPRYRPSAFRSFRPASGRSGCDRRRRTGSGSPAHGRSRADCPASRADGPSTPSVRHRQGRATGAGPSEKGARSAHIAAKRRPARVPSSRPGGCRRRSAPCRIYARPRSPSGSASRRAPAG